MGIVVMDLTMNSDDAASVKIKEGNSEDRMISRKIPGNPNKYAANAYTACLF